MMNKILYTIWLPFILCLECGWCEYKSVSVKIFAWKIWTSSVKLVWIKLSDSDNCNGNANRPFTKQ